MNGITNLKELLSTMQPELNNGEYIFASLGYDALSDIEGIKPLATFCEEEGLTVILDKSMALKNNISFETVFSLITLTVHSSLEAVGLTAAFSQKLASKGISANVMAGYYHDHIFVQKERDQEALEALIELQQENLK